MSGIILPAKKPDGLDAFDIFGTLRVGDIVLFINQIQSVELNPVGSVHVTLSSGARHLFQDDDAEKFLKASQALKETILRNMTQPQVVGVPPGARIR